MRDNDWLWSSQQLFYHILLKGKAQNSIWLIQSYLVNLQRKCGCGLESFMSQSSLRTTTTVHPTGFHCSFPAEVGFEPGSLKFECHWIYKSQTLKETLMHWHSMLIHAQLGTIVMTCSPWENVQQVFANGQYFWDNIPATFANQCNELLLRM